MHVHGVEVPHAVRQPYWQLPMQEAGHLMYYVYE